MIDDIDVSDRPEAEIVEGLKRAGEASDSSPQAGADRPEEPAEAPGDRITVSDAQIDEAVGKSWKVIWGIVARRTGVEELEEDAEDVKAARDALGPLARKYFRQALANAGPETVAAIFLADTAERKYQVHKKAQDHG